MMFGKIMPFLSSVGGHILVGVCVYYTIVPTMIVPPPSLQMIEVTIVAPTIIQEKSSDVLQTDAQDILKKNAILSAQKHVSSFSTVQDIVQITSGITDVKAKTLQSAITKNSVATPIHNPSPPYPYQARKHHQQGTVLMTVTIDRNGDPKNIAIKKSSGHPMLDQTARETLQKWHFIPAQKKGISIESVIDIPIRFQLEPR